MINLKKIKSYVLWKANVLKTPLKIYYFNKLNMKKRSCILPKRKQKIIVSLTSYSKRFKTLDLCIKSIMTQTVKPDRIILYLTEEEKDVVPDELLDLEKYGLEIRYVYEDYRPHKKYMYAMREYPNDLIITIDDDAIYDHRLIEKLVKTHKKYPFAIVTGRARKIELRENTFGLYNTWQLSEDEEKPSMLLIATGVGGVLYPPKLLDIELLTNETYIKQYINVDDLWLKAVEILSGVPTVLCSKNLDRNRVDIPSAQKQGLFNTNTGEDGNNDKKWKQLDECFKLFNRLKEPS